MRVLLAAGGVTPARVRLWEAPLIFAADRFEINSRLRRIHWLATLIHESGGFSQLEENLNYSARGLLKTWPSRFTPQEAADYARNPRRIANRVYADRMGNGNESSGDGWRYRGRGPIQITGRDNYLLAADDCSVDVVSEPDLLLRPTHGAFSAGGFWARNHCNEWADADDVTAIRRRVNGGTIGLAEVRSLVDDMKNV